MTSNLAPPGGGTLMLQGRYRDVVTDPRGERAAGSPWRPNLVLDGAFALVSALLKRDRSMEGILFWAVGAGDPEWDRSQPATQSRTTRLVSEVLRLPVPRDAITYVDERGAPSSRPTPDLEIRLAFEWPDERMTLREFGVFGGNAAARPNSGVMINHVIHRRIDLEPGQRLSRELRLSLGRAVDRRWLDVPPHWLSDAESRVVDGVGDQFAGALSRMGLATMEALALSDPDAPGDGIPALRLLEFRAKARLALRTAAEIHPPQGLHELTVTQVLRGKPGDLALKTGVPEREVIRLREQLSTLELAMDHRFLGPHKVGTLAGGGK